MVCPVGALYGVLGRFRFLGVKVDAALCADCGQCQRVCSMRVNAGSSKPFQMMNCVNCADCINYCPTGAVNFSFKFYQKGVKTNDEPI